MYGGGACYNHFSAADLMAEGGGGGPRIHLFSDSYVVASCYNHFSAADLMGEGGGA